MPAYSYLTKEESKVSVFTLYEAKVHLGIDGLLSPLGEVTTSKPGHIFTRKNWLVNDLFEIKVYHGVHICLLIQYSSKPIELLCGIHT